MMRSWTSWRDLRISDESKVRTLIREWGYAPLDAVQRMGLEEAANRMVRQGRIQRVEDSYLALHNDHPNHHIQLAVARVKEYLKLKAGGDDESRREG